VRITDTAALECAKEAAGELRLDIEAAFSQGLPNTPMSNAQIRIVSGNFVTARPLGVIDGVDLELTGVTRKIAAETIHPILQTDNVVLLSPLGLLADRRSVQPDDGRRGRRRPRSPCTPTS
jgi:amino-acid N-acetyltransferase